MGLSDRKRPTLQPVVRPASLVCYIAMIAAVVWPVWVVAAQPVASFEAKLQAIESIVEAADNEAWVALFAEDAVVMPPNGRPVRGSDAIRALYAPAYEGYASIQVDFQLEAVDTEGDLAVLRYSGEATLTRESGQSYHSSTHYVDVLRRQPDGTWLITLHAWSREASVRQ